MSLGAPLIRPAAPTAGLTGWFMRAALRPAARMG